MFLISMIVGAILGFIISTVGMCKFNWYRDKEEYVAFTFVYILFGFIWFAAIPLSIIGGVFWGICHLAWKACPNK